MNKSLKTKQLECFIAVAEELNFRIAAERLHMTQPPLSRQIKKLEETLNTQLFNRDRSGVTLTEAGEKFLQDARAILQKNEETIEKFRDHHSEPFELNIGITTVVDTDIYQDFVSLLMAKFPDVKFNIKPDLSINLIKNLKRGALDIALIGMPSTTEMLVVEHLFADPLMAAIPADHALAKKKKISILELENENLFWFNRELNPSYYDFCKKTFKDMNFAPRFIPEPADHHVLLSLISNKNGVALMPESLKNLTRKGVSYRPLKEGKLLSVGIGIAYSPNNHSFLIEASVELIRDYCIREGLYQQMTNARHESRQKINST